MTGLQIIQEERLRQQTEEKRSSANDDGYIKGELAIAAKVYYQCAVDGLMYVRHALKDWPWASNWFKPWASGDPSKFDVQRCLVKAGALAMAERDRMNRFIASWS